MTKLSATNPESSDPLILKSSIFTDYARYYDLLYQDKDYTAEVEYVVELICKFHSSAKSILELGSGTGIHASLLAERGFTLHGIERSPEMLARSQLLAGNGKIRDNQLTFTAGDIREVRLGKRYDVVIALFHVISYQTTNEDVTAAFETVKHHLNPGGVFIFDVWYGPAVLTERPAVRIKRVTDEKIAVTRLAEPVLHPNQNRVDVNYHIFVRNIATQVVAELQETHAMRYFFQPEIEIIAAQQGLKILNAEEWLTGKPIGQDTWGVCFVLKTFLDQNNHDKF